MLTSSEAAFLGMALGATLTWIFGIAAADRQWRRDEKRRQVDRRATLYQEMLSRDGTPGVSA